MPVTQYVAGVGGVQLPVSGQTTSGVTGTSGAQLLVGSAGNDAFRGGGGGDTLQGWAGDDTYNVYDIHDLAVEAPGQGIDSVISTVSCLLGANIENLSVLSDKTYGGGNDLDNIITGGAGSQTLDGKGGDDVLTGGAGADIFVMARGYGHDVIADFQNGVDSVRLDNFGLTSFSQVHALLSQQGPDVALSLPSGEEVLFRNHKISDFSAQDFKLQLDTSGMAMSFDEEFNALSLWNGKSGVWNTAFGGGGTVANRTLASNGEKEVYMDPNFAGTGTTPLGVNPFSLNNGVVDITAARATPAVSAAINGYQYTSGLLTTKYSFSQEYGYFEVRAKLPSGQGLWPALWLLPANGSWPPEIDIFEQLGKDPSTIYETAHSKASGSHTWQQQPIHIDNPDQFHTYGLLWDHNNLVWSIDGVETGRQATPADMNQPMYLLLNLAVGGGWPGDPNASTPLPATMSIDYVHIYQLNGVQTGPPTPPVSSAPPPTTTHPPGSDAPGHYSAAAYADAARAAANAAAANAAAASAYSASSYGGNGYAANAYAYGGYGMSGYGAGAYSMGGYPTSGYAYSVYTPSPQTSTPPPAQPTVTHPSDSHPASAPQPVYHPIVTPPADPSPMAAPPDPYGMYNANLYGMGYAAAYAGDGAHFMPASYLFY